MTDGGRRRPAGPIGREPPDAWQAAVKMLAVRARSGHEVREALRRRGYPPDEIAAAIARLAAARYLDDAEFARTWMATRARRGAAAPVRLARELRAKGVAEEDIAAALRALQGEWDSAAAAAEAARRKLKTLQGLTPEAARRRLAAHLERRGFDRETVLATCRRQVPHARGHDGE
jgi:regulatory protein